MKFIVRATVGLMVVLSGLLIAGSASAVTSTQAASASSHAVARPNSLPPDWVPWDGNHITTDANCEARRRYLMATYEIASKDMQCQEFPNGTCPVSYYWMVMVNANREEAVEQSAATEERTFYSTVAC